MYSVLTKRRRAVFLDVLRRTGNVSAAARAADMARCTLYHQRDKDSEFARSWSEALDEATDDLEHALRQRAVLGTDKAVYYGGKACGSVRSYSDQAGMFLLRVRRPDVFDGVQEGQTQGARDKLAERLEAMSDNTAQ